MGHKLPRLSSNSQSRPPRSPGATRQSQVGSAASSRSITPRSAHSIPEAARSRLVQSGPLTRNLNNQGSDFPSDSSTTRGASVPCKAAESAGVASHWPEQGSMASPAVPTDREEIEQDDNRQFKRNRLEAAPKQEQVVKVNGFANRALRSVLKGDADVFISFNKFVTIFQTTFTG